MEAGDSSHSEENGLILGGAFPMEAEQDKALKEETTLGACLMRILNTGKDQHHIGGNQICPHAEDLTAMEGGLRHPSTSCSACNITLNIEDGVDYAQLPEEEKLQRWRAAGVALRKALHAEPNSSGPRCKGQCVHHRGKKSSRAEDPMNAMLEDYENQNHGNQASQGSTQTKGDDEEARYSKEALKEQKRKKRKSSVGDPDVEIVPPGLLSVREKIKEITSKIKDKDLPIPMGSSGKPSSAKERGRLSRNASKEVDSSSDSGGEQDVARPRPTPKCRRTLSTGSSKLVTGDDGSQERRRSRENVKGHSPQPRQSPHPLCIDNTDHTDFSLEQQVSALKLSEESKSDVESDILSKKFQMLSQRQSSCDDSMNSRKLCKPSQKLNRLSTVETDSMPNLADIESSPVSDEPDTVTESEAEVFHPAGRTCRNSLCRGGVLIGGKTEDFGVCLEGQVSGSLGSCYVCGTEAEDTRRSSERSQDTPTGRQQAHVSDDDDTGCDCLGDDDDDLEDVIDLDLSQPSSSSGANASKVSLTPEDLEKLPNLVWALRRRYSQQLGQSDSASYLQMSRRLHRRAISSCSASDQDADADDEFECDCSVCQQRRGSRKDWTTDEDTELHGMPAGDTIEYRPNNGEGGLSEGLSINLAELTPLDLLLMRDGRREVIDLMFQNVIMQMLSVYPDLLSDQAPPPASPSTIHALPTVRIVQAQTEKDFVCPICLCNFEAEEEARQLPCHHMFHTLCIQAWLSKSGTCPVCRHTLQKENLN